MASGFDQRLQAVGLSAVSARRFRFGERRRGLM
jgi:hypothetical protein